MPGLGEQELNQRILDLIIARNRHRLRVLKTCPGESRRAEHREEVQIWPLDDKLKEI